MMLAETREEIKENTWEEEEAMTATSGAKREETKKSPVVIPYIKDFSKELKKAFGRFGVSSGEGQSCGPSV